MTNRATNIVGKWKLEKKVTDSVSATTTAAQTRDYQQENNDCVANLASKICYPRWQKFATTQLSNPVYAIITF